MSTRIYQNGTLSTNTHMTLSDEASHHLLRVLRARVGDELVIFNGQGDEYRAIITTLHKKLVDVAINEGIETKVESPLKLYLAQGIARGEKMDFIVQKAVELGVSKIFPLVTERCNVHLDAKRQASRLQHWQAIAISACEQSGRTQIPEVAAPQRLGAWLNSIQADAKWVLSPHVSSPLSAKPTRSYASVALLIGPEGGLSDAEVANARAHQFEALSLGPRVLRTETATIAAMTVIQSLFGDLIS